MNFLSDKKANENLKESRSKWNLCSIITINIFIWILSIGCIVGIGYGAAYKVPKYISDFTSTEDDNG